MSREMLDGKREQSQLLGVRLRSEGKDYYAIRAEDGKFYDRNGTGLAKGFLRFPTARQFRVSSNFNPRRLNPVTGRVAPASWRRFCDAAGYAGAVGRGWRSGGG
ncbi:cell wall endopeptidase [Klebsiella michiganensis]|nr:cell wall endopeptidase [Klebsiella michiganensis]